MTDEEPRRAAIDQYFREGNSGEALRAVDDLLSSYARDKDSRRMVQVLEAWAAAYPGEMGLRSRLASLYQQLGRKQAAIEQLDQLGELQLAAGQHDDARTTIRQIMALVKGQASLPARSGRARTERLKVLEMIDSGKLTPAEGERLLVALQPLPAASIGALLTALFKMSGEQPLRLRVVVAGETPDAPQTAFTVPLVQVEQVMTTILQAVFQGQRGKIAHIHDLFGRIELFVEADKD